MLKKGLILTSLALLSVAAFGDIRRDPNGVNVNSQGATSVFISFGGLADQVPVEATWCGALISAAPDIGQKCDPATLFGRLPLRFDQSRLSTDGSLFSDVMTIPPSVSRRAWQAAARGEESRFFYVRRFQSLVGGPDEYVFVTCRLTGGGARTPLALTDVRIEFENQGNITRVNAGGELPRFAAAVSYNGTGRLVGRWEVVMPTDEPPTSEDLLTEATLPPDARVRQRRYTDVGRFNIFMAPTGQIVLPGPDVKRLPTDVDGLYQVLLRIEATDDKEANSNLGSVGADGLITAGAVAGFPLPVLRYYVGVGEGIDLRADGDINLLTPKEGASVLPDQVVFSWNQSTKARFYRLEVQNDAEEEVISSVLQQGIGSYRLPTFMAGEVSGRTLRFRVVAMGAEGKPVAETSWRTITIR